MSGVKVVGLQWTSVGTQATSEEFQPATQWMPTAEMDRVRAMFEIAAHTPPDGAGVQELDLAPGYQYANVENNPAGSRAIEGLQHEDDVYYPADWNGVIATDLEGYQLVRFGWILKCTGTPTSPGTARVAGKVEIQTV